MDQEYNQSYLQELSYKWQTGTLTPEEEQRFQEWEDGLELDLLELPESYHGKEFIIRDRLIKNVLDRIKEEKVNKQVKLWPRIATVAAAVAAIVFGIWFYNTSGLFGGRHLDARRDLLNYANDIAPGKNTATITLADGSTIELSDAKTGVVVGAGSLKYNDNTAVISNEEINLLNSTDKRSLPYGRDDGKGQYDGKVAMTSVATPRGGTYQITLPDGSKVWLNAASSLKFPATFAALKDRRVQLVGEAYFEVAKDKTHPFIVITDKQEVEVLGTHFNINSYADEPATKTTLLEGSVRVAYAPGHLESSPHPESSRHLKSSRHLDDRRTDQRELNETAKNNNSSELNLLNSTDKGSLPAGRDDGARRDDGQSAAITLKPNQQATNTGATIKVTQVDTELAIAWKNNQFLFEEQDLRSIMRMVSRWYNVDVEYAPDVTNEKFGGGVSRFDNVSKVLEALEETGNVHFRIEGRKIYVQR